MPFMLFILSCHPRPPRAVQQDGPIGSRVEPEAVEGKAQPFRLSGLERLSPYGTGATT